MAWTTPRTYITGEVVTAAILNADVRDNLAFLYDIPAALAYHNLAQSIPHNAATVLSLNSERYDSDAMHDNATDNSRLTIRTAGLYEFLAGAEFDAVTTGTRQLDILINGSIAIGVQKLSAASSGGTNMQVGARRRCVVGDYAQARATQTSGAGLNVNYKGEWSPFLAAEWRSAA